MRNNVAYIVDQIYTITGSAPVKKALQKIVFLIEKKGVRLGYHYILHFYGPYCAELDNETLRLSTEGVIHFDYTGFGHKMTIDKTTCSRPVEANLSEASLQLIKDVIGRYKKNSPSDLELLTTAIYAYEHTDAKTAEAVRKNIKMIKGEKYSDAEIAWAINEFPYYSIQVQ